MYLNVRFIPRKNRRRFHLYLMQEPSSHGPVWSKVSQWKLDCRQFFLSPKWFAQWRKKSSIWHIYYLSEKAHAPIPSHPHSLAPAGQKRVQSNHNDPTNSCFCFKNYTAKFRPSVLICNLCILRFARLPACPQTTQYTVDAAATTVRSLDFCFWAISLND